MSSQSLLPWLFENAASDEPTESLSFPYNIQNLEDFPLSFATMFMNPSFRDTLYDQELENQFGRLNISSNNTHHHQSIYGNNNLLNNVGIGPVIGNNSLPFGFQDFFRFEELQRLRAFQSEAEYMHQQQGVFNADLNMRFLELPRSSNNNSHRMNIPRSFNTNHGLQNPHEYSAVMNGYNLDQYNNMYPNYGNGGFFNNGENPSRYLSSSLDNVENDRVQPEERVWFSDLKSLRGSIYMVAQDKEGCRFLQKRIDERKPEEIEMIFREVRLHVRELMVDQFGNYVIQKLFEVCNLHQINQFLVILLSNMNWLLAICVDSHGTKTIQKLLEYLATEEQRTCVVSALQHITLDLCKNPNGHHVIRHCLKYFTITENKKILDVVVLNCFEIATDRSGCCVLQQCVEHAQGEHRNLLVNEIIKNALLLAENRYGNYVVQYLLGLGIRLITNGIVSHLRSHYVSLSMNKYGSNVVERCLKEADGVQANKIIREIISHNKFLMVLQDSYGNYVAQCALEKAQGPIRDKMIRAIQDHYPSLHSHPHGKRVFARARRSTINRQRQPNNTYDDIL